jgi:hypothetical protein
VDGRITDRIVVAQIIHPTGILRELSIKRSQKIVMELISKHKMSISINGKLCIKAILLTYLIMVQPSCKKLVEIPAPGGAITESNVYASNETAIAVLSGIYNSMNAAPEQPFQGSQSISLFTGLSSDELTLYSGITNETHLGYYKNALSAITPPVSGSEFWALLYNYVFRSNAAIEGLSSSTTLTPIVKQQLLGEAKFIRAFFYFYLVNLFGDVVLSLSTDPQVNTLLPRTPKAQVYEHIINDLKEAQELLSSNYVDATLLSTTIERVRPTKWAAAALLARVYLYTKDYARAEEQATIVVNNTALYSLPDINSAFLKNSREAIWQIQPTRILFNTEDARTYIIPPSGPTHGVDVTNPVHLSYHLLNSFEVGDQRALYGNWIDTTIFKINTIEYDTVTYPFKYKVNTSNEDINLETGTQNMTEYFMILRLSEQYLIRAEARAQQNNIGGSQSDLNAIRNRAGLSPTTAVDKTTLLAAILHERQVELFAEWGHRWFDLKRTGNVESVMNIVTPAKANGQPWQSYQQLYPLPLSDLNTAPNLVQNPGY